MWPNLAGFREATWADLVDFVTSMHRHASANGGKAFDKGIDEPRPSIAAQVSLDLILTNGSIMQHQVHTSVLQCKQGFGNRLWMRSSQG